MSSEKKHANHESRPIGSGEEDIDNLTNLTTINDDDGQSPLSFRNPTHSHDDAMTKARHLDRTQPVRWYVLDSAGSIPARNIPDQTGTSKRMEGEP